jgi:hypothetical protein
MSCSSRAILDRSDPIAASARARCASIASAACTRMSRTYCLRVAMYAPKNAAAA